MAVLLGVRTTRSGPLLWCAAPDDPALPPSLGPGEPVLLEDRGQSEIGFVVIRPGQLLNPEGITPDATIRATGYESSEVTAALARRNAAALEAAREHLDPRLEPRDAAWHLDRSRLTVVLEAEPTEGREESRDRLAAALGAEVRFAWPGGEEVPSLGSSGRRGASAEPRSGS